jgi:hypothetical protein
MRKILSTLFLAGASSAVFAGAVGNQVITANPQIQDAAANSSVSVGIDYNTEPVDETLSGLGLRVHFDSSQLTFNSATYGPDATSDQQPVSGPTDDADDFDSDPDTDQFIILSWVNLGGNFPGVDPATLASVDFTTAADFSGSTTVNFSASSTPPGFQLGPNSATINGTGDPGPGPGPDTDPTPVPDADLVGQPSADAAAALTAAGFTTVNTVEVFDADATPGTVLSVTQDPATRTATLTIATDLAPGPGPGPTPGPGGPFVPSPAQPIPSLSSFGLLLLTPLLGLVVMFRRKK